MGGTMMGVVEEGRRQVIAIMDDPKFIERIKEVIAYAYEPEHIMTEEDLEEAIEAGHSKIQLEPERVVVLPEGNKFVFVIEQQPCGLSRHLAAMNVNAGQVINPMVMALLMKLLGFRNGMEAIGHSKEIHGWNDDVSKGRMSINIIEVVEPGVHFIPEDDEEDT